MPGDQPVSLVKYCSAETAINILSDAKLRWSAPHLFSNPFETDRETDLGFTIKELLNAAMQAACGMIFALNAPSGSSSFVAAVKRWRNEERFSSPSEAETVLKGLLENMVSLQEPLLDKLVSDWRYYADTQRVCSFSLKPNVVQSWDNYADQHQGVALRFMCGDGTSLPKPRRLAYKNKRPNIISMEDQLAIMLEDARINPRDFFIENLCTKSALYKHEREWRCFHSIVDDNTSDGSSTQEYIDRPFDRAEMTGAFFGLHTDDKDKTIITELVRKHYPKGRIYQAKMMPQAYEVDFDRLP